MLTKEELWDLCTLMRPSLKIQNEISFGDMNIKVPDIDFYPDSALYYDPSANMIHLGVYALIDIFRVSSEEEVQTAVSYVRQHEEEHCRSTATVPYGWGITRGCEIVLEYIAAREEPSRKRFRGQKDYEAYADELAQRGIYISYRMLGEIIGGIANSLEDGRIERKRSAHFPGFEKLRMIYRGIFWDSEAQPFKPYDEIRDDVPEKLRLITNEILSLATCQLYSKGFAAAYAGTPLMDEIRPLMPHIAKGVMAGRTRDMAFEVVEISKLLAPYLYEVCKLSASDVQAKQALEKLLSDLIKSMVDNMPEGDLSEANEDVDDGSGNSVFPESDLVITLDDETYDKLTKNSKSSGSSGGLMIRREHPKEEEPSEDGDGDGNGSEGQDGKGSDGKGKGSSGQQSGDPGEGSGSGSSGEGESADGKGGNGNSGSPEGGEKDGSEGSGSSGDGDQSEGSAQGTSSGSSGGESGSRNKEDSSNANDEGSGSTGSSPKGDSQRGKGTTSEEAVRKAMKEAAEEMNEQARAEIDNVNVQNSRITAAERKTKVVPDTSKPITKEYVKDICQNFRELKRAYRLTENLPSVLKARGTTMLRKNQQFFKSLSTPNISFLDSGSVDPSRIYGLAFGDTEIFRKKGKDRKFDGCAYILIDNSGSMSGNKRIEACKAAAVIEESFRGIMPIKIVAYDDGADVIHEVIKGWDEQQTKNCCWNFCLHGRDGGGTPTGESVLIAQREIMARPERNKMIVVLTDGCPNDRNLTKRAISETRKKGVSVFGIYFEEGDIGFAADTFYDLFDHRDIVATTVDGIDEELFNLFKKFSRK